MSHTLHRFHGGIHPPEQKEQTRELPITPFHNRGEVVISLNQGIRAVNRPIVQVGERVTQGQRLSECFNPLSVPVHAPCNGTVTAIEDRPFTHPSGLKSPAIVLQASGYETNTLEPRTVAELVDGLSGEEILQRIRMAGVIGLGGAGFPTAPKLQSGVQRRIDTLILNGMECEPRITCDDRLMRERPEEIIRGIEVLHHLLQPQQILVGIEENKPEAIAAMEQAARQSSSSITIVTCPTLYPSGGEKQLIQILTGNEVPSGRHAYQIGILMQNVATAAAIYRAMLGYPLTHRVVTVTGSGVRRPGNYEVAVGTPIEELLQQCEMESAVSVTLGGPMMGYRLQDLQSPLTKTSNCLIVEPATGPGGRAPIRNCIRCAACSDACPARLLPQQLFWATQSRNFDDAEALHLFDCIECGCCSYVCPSKIPLVDYYRHAKGVLRNQQQEQQRAEYARKRHEFREARLQHEQEEKARKLAEKRAALKAKEAQQQTEGGDNDKDSKRAAIEAALARAKAKKAQRQQTESDANDPAA
jgi:electron transport complex protein RnfC